MKKFHTEAELKHAKATLKAKGWSYRSVSPVLGVGWVHLARVLNGHRQSRRLLAAIDTLPVSVRARPCPSLNTEN